MTGGTSFRDCNGIKSSVDEDILSRHAMLLIGYRYATPGNASTEVVFLLQNWWECRYFIEVSASYLSVQQ